MLKVRCSKIRSELGRFSTILYSPIRDASARRMVRREGLHLPARTKAKQPSAATLITHSIIVPNDHGSFIRAPMQQNFPRGTNVADSSVCSFEDSK